MPPHKDFELLCSSLMKRTQHQYKRASQDFVEYCKRREIEVYNNTKLDEILHVYIHHVFRALGRDVKGYAKKVCLCA